METLNQNYKSAKQLYSEHLSELGLPEKLQDSNKYDWNLWREFHNWLKQINGDPDYLPNPDELGFLEEIQSAIILKEYGVKVDPQSERDWVIAVLEQRIDIRDSVLMPDDYCTIDNRIPLDIVSGDEAESLFRAIHPDRHKSWNLPLLPINNYYDYINVPSNELEPIAVEMPTEADIDRERILSGLPPLNNTSNQMKSDEMLGEDFLKNNHLPIDTYGKLAKSLINEFSQAYKVNSDVIAAIILLIVGSAANRKTTLRAWNYINRPCFWLAIVERSGSNKSEPMSRLMKPLAAINKDLCREFNKAYADFAASGSKGTPPARQKIIISDSTPEIRYQLMVTNGLVLVRDELNGFFKDIGRYSSSGEVENLLSTWSGQGFPVDRVNAASFEVETPFLSIIGGIQPRVMAEAFGAKGFAESGFIPRWLFVVPTDSRVPDSVSEKLIDKDLENEWYSLILSLWRMERREFRLSTEAEKAYQGYMRRTADIMNAPDCDDAVRANYAKMRIYCLRFALTIHLLKHGAKAVDEVDRKTMDSAIRTCDVFAYWNRQALSLICGTEAKKSISNAELLRLLCERYNVTNQSELARLIGRSQQYLSKILNNKK